MDILILTTDAEVLIKWKISMEKQKKKLIKHNIISFKNKSTKVDK